LGVISTSVEIEPFINRPESAWWDGNRDFWAVLRGNTPLRNERIRITNQTNEAIRVKWHNGRDPQTPELTIAANGVHLVIDPLFFSVLIFGLVLSINLFWDKRGKANNIVGGSFLTARNRITFTIIVSCIILTIFIGVNALINVAHPTITRQLILPMQNVNVIRDNADLIYELPTEPIMLMIQSRSADYITSDSLSAELDLSGLSFGTHDVELRFDLPRNTSVRNSPVILRVVINQ